MFALHIGGANRVRRLKRTRRPEWVLSFTFVFLLAVLLGAYSVSDVLADSDIDVPINLSQVVADGVDSNIGEPEANGDEKLVLSVTTATSDVRETVWTHEAAAFVRPFFAGRRHTLPPINAPPGAFI